MRKALQIIGLLSFFFAWRSSDCVTYKLTNVKCESLNQSWVTINECRLKAISRDKTIFNFNASLHQPTKDIVMDWQLLKRASGYKPWLYKKKIDGCKFMRKPYDALTILFFNIYRPFSNINHTCPYSGDLLVRGMHLTTKLTLPYPSGDYMLQINWLFYRKVQFVTNISYEFVENII
ncbi:uncharacterized protein LOC108113890 [Drosophila eugracilis]|uniref:uncharacterized protein LOC108113890 n=1 Tax=Drosophila eugracilis TaxID=29029 RepID=UPI0007E61ACF|nr:uncharacterized protein LOC108113890 [Drosophila eugracilis]